MKLDFSDFFVKNILGNTFSNICACRMAAYITQNCYCYITGKILVPKERELHHIIPVSCGGLDTIENTIVLNRNVHRLIHCSNQIEIIDLMNKIKPTKAQFTMINQYRYEAYQSTISNMNAKNEAA